MFFWKERSNSKAESYWRAKIVAIGSDSKNAWKTVHMLLGETKTKCDSSCSVVDYHDFADKKIDDMRKVTDSANAPSYTVHFTLNLDKFKTVDVDLVTKIIR